MFKPSTKTNVPTLVSHLLHVSLMSVRRGPPKGVWTILWFSPHVSIMMFINGCVEAEASVAQRPDICICSQLGLLCVLLKRLYLPVVEGKKRSVLQQFVSWSALVSESAAAFIWCSRLQPQTFKTCSIVTRSLSVIDVFSPELTSAATSF